MKYSNKLLFGVVVFALAACSPAIPEPTETITPSETLLPTNTPTVTITPSPTLTPTSTLTPTPAGTPFAGASGLFTFCDPSYFIYDLSTHNHHEIEIQGESREERSRSSIMVRLVAMGIPEELLFSTELPSEYFSSCCFSIIAVSRMSNSALFYQYGRAVELSKLVWVDFDSQEINEIYEGSIFIEQMRRRIKFNLKTDEVFFEVIGNERDYSDIFVVDMTDGTIQNITESQDSKVDFLGVSHDAIKVSYSTDEGIWVYDRSTIKHAFLYRRNAVGAIDWHPIEDLIMFNSIDGVILMDSYGGNIRNLNSIIGSIGFFYRPHWTPDGKLASWVKTEGNWWEEEEGSWSWIIIDLENKEYQLYENFLSEELLVLATDFFVFSPDQQWFAAEANILIGENTGDTNTYVCDINNESCTKLGATEYDDKCEIINWVDKNIDIKSLYK